MRLLLILLILPVSLWGQKIEYEKTDSIQIDTYTLQTYSLRINNYSASDPAKVFVAPYSSFDSIKKQIPTLYFSRKQEYNEFYLLGVLDMSQTENVKRALTEFLKHVDSSRVGRNRSTFLQLYIWDNINNKILYQPISKELSQLDNVHFLNSTKDLCKHMVCKNK